MKRIYSILSLLLLCSIVAFADSDRVVIANDVASHVVINSIEGNKVTLTVTPAEGQYLADISAMKTVDASAAAPQRRADIPVGAAYTLTKTSTTADRSQEATYTMTLDDGFGAYVTATFADRTAITADQITLSAASFTYNGSDQKATVSIDGLTLDTDYTISYKETAWVNAGTYTVTVTGIDRYMGTAEKTWTVVACQSSEAVVALDIPTEGYTYDGTEKTPAVTVTIGGVTVDATEYTVSYADHVNAGTATVTVDDKPGGNYAFAPVSKTFEIGKATVTVTAADQTKGYGDADPELTYTAAGLVGSDGISGTLGRTAGEDVGDYAILLGSLDAGSNYTFVLAGNGAKLTITKKSLKDSNIEISITDYATCSIAVKQDGVPIDVNNYTATKHATKENTVTITGTGNYAGEIDVTLVSADFEKPADAATDADCCAAAQVSQDMALPEGMVAVMLTGTDPQKGIATAKALDYIPAGVPVILMKKDDADGFTAKDITPGTASGTTEVTDADKAACPLKVADSNTAALQGYQDYVWFKGELVLVSNTAKPVSGTFYVKNSSTPTPAPKLQIVIGEEEETTSLPSIDHSSLTIDHSEGAWFSLDGRKINGQPLKKGLYIHNGKKTVIK